MFDVFVSSPYSDSDPAVVEQRVKAAQQYVARLAINRTYALSAIAYMYPIIGSASIQLPGDYQYWKDLCIKAMKSCKSVHVLCLPGWKTSTGVQDEIKIAHELGLLITYVYPPSDNP